MIHESHETPAGQRVALGASDGAWFVQVDGATVFHAFDERRARVVLLWWLDGCTA